MSRRIARTFLEHPKHIPNPARIQLEPRTNVKHFIREAFGSPYVLVWQRHYNGKAVSTVDLTTALADFLEFVQSCKQPVLFGHNLQMCLYSLKQYQMVGEFSKAIISFVDILKVDAKDNLPGKLYR